MSALPIEELHVDAEFEALLPASADEMARLKEEVMNGDGFRDPILYWANPDDGKPCIVDGHRRYRLWKDDPDIGDIAPSTKAMRFKDRDAVKEWMFRNQLCRRNLGKRDRDKALANLLELEKRKTPSAEARSQNGYVPQGRAVDRVAKATGVPAKTVQNSAKRHNDRELAVRTARVKVAKADPHTDEEIGDGKWSPTDDELLALGHMGHGEIREAMKRRRIGEAWMPAVKAKSNGKPKPTKSPKKQSIAKTVDEYRKKCVGPLVRGIDIIAGINGGKGENWNRANTGLSEVEAALKEMRKGKA